MPSFTRPRTIRFGDTDPAGIVFYPRYFEMLVEVIEDFFALALDMPFARLHLELGLGIPLVDVHAEFLRPSRLGEVVDFTLTVTRFGRTSFTTDIIAACAGETRLRARLTMVFTHMATARAVPPPQAVAARLAAFASQGQAADAGAATDEKRLPGDEGVGRIGKE
jgi:4-hydroxybenzoyl-CoA thioesterase